MPNPLTSSAPLNTSQGAQREPVTPVVENYAGNNIPYRGVVDHGVDAGEVDPHRPVLWDDGRAVEQELVEDDDTPVVPVRIVNQQSAREFRTFRTSPSYAGGATYGRARQILGQDENRNSARIRNTSETETVWIGESPETANSLAGYPILPGESETLAAHSAVYASTEQADDLLVYVLVEYSQAV